MRVESQYIFPEDIENRSEHLRYARWGLKGLAVELSASDPPQQVNTEYKIEGGKIDGSN